MQRLVSRTMRFPKTATACLGIFFIVLLFKKAPSSTMTPTEAPHLPPPDASVIAKAVEELSKPRRKRSGSWASELETIDEDILNVNLTEIQTTIKERKATRDQACSTLQEQEKKTYSVNPREFVISDKYKLIWCNIFKSASSTWFYNFLTLAGISDKSMKKSKSSPVQFARKTAYPRPSEDHLSRVLKDDSYTSFIVVREPFERLLSGYRDKIESKQQMFYNNLRCKMTGGTKTWGRSCSPSFPDFVEYIIMQTTKGEKLDEHWHPYTSFCAPCIVDYTYILHFETLTAEEYFMFQEVPGLAAKLDLYRLWSSHTEDYEALLLFYFNQLTRQQLDKLIHIYRDDFLLGGYTWDKYYGYVS